LIAGGQSRLDSRVKALVTGGGGFLGQNLVRALLARGDGVRVLGRSAYPELEKLGVECVRGDVREVGAVDAAVRGVDSVFHIAARVGYWGPREEYVTTNVGGTRNVIEACRKHRVPRLVYTSTPSVVIGPGSRLEGVDETTPYPEKHLNDYGSTKAEAEASVLAANGGALATVALRPHFIYGPGDPQIVPRLIDNARRGTLVRIGDGTNKVDVTYIDNCVSAHLLAHDALIKPGSPAAGQAYFIGDPDPVVLWDFVERVLRAFDAPPIKRRLSFGAAHGIGAAVEGIFRLFGVQREPPIARSVAVIMGTSHYFSHAKARRDFGYDPAITTDEGLRRTVEHHRAHATSAARAA
jgi:2-alkyl-3-oxoalkanoate reductase